MDILYQENFKISSSCSSQNHMYSSTEMQRKLSKVSPFVVSSSNLNVKTSFMKVIFHVNINLVPHTRRAQVLNFQLQWRTPVSFKPKIQFSLCVLMCLCFWDFFSNESDICHFGQRSFFLLFLCSLIFTHIYVW